MSTTPSAENDAGGRWTDRWVALWYRLTYCTRHGHYKVHEGRCLTCGARVNPPGDDH